MKAINHKKEKPTQSSIVLSYILAPNTANHNRPNRLMEEWLQASLHSVQEGDPCPLHRKGNDMR